MHARNERPQTKTRNESEKKPNEKIPFSWYGTRSHVFSQPYIFCFADKVNSFDQKNAWHRRSTSCCSFSWWLLSQPPYFSSGWRWISHINPNICPGFFFIHYIIVIINEKKTNDRRTTTWSIKCFRWIWNASEFSNINSAKLKCLNFFFRARRGRNSDASEAIKL